MRYFGWDTEYLDMDGHWLAFSRDLLVNKELGLASHSLIMQQSYEIPNFLPMRCDKSEERITLSFALRGKRMLGQWYRSNPPGVAELRQLLLSIQTLANITLRYMLRLETVILDPEWIFVNPASGEFGYIHLPIQTAGDNVLTECMSRLVVKLHPLASEEGKAFLEQLQNRMLKQPFELGHLIREDVTEVKSDILSIADVDVKAEVKSWFFLPWFRRTDKHSLDAIPAKQDQPDLAVQQVHQTICIVPQIECTNLWDQQANERYLLTGEEFVIGRDEQRVQLLVTDLAASRLHAELRVDEGIWFVRDLGSRNGTVLNGLKLAPYQPKALQAGDQIKIANRLFMFCLANAELEVNRVEYAHTDFN